MATNEELPTVPPDVSAFELASLASTIAAGMIGAVDYTLIPYKSIRLAIQILTLAVDRVAERSAVGLPRSPVPAEGAHEWEPISGNAKQSRCRRCRLIAQTEALASYTQCGAA